MKRATDILHRPIGLMIGFLLPAVALFLVFFIYPLLSVLWISLHEGNVASEARTWVGLDNYRRLMSDGVFWWMVRNTLLVVVIGGGATLVLSLGTAVGLTKIRRGRNFFRIVFLFPNIMSAVATAVLWSFIFNPSFGILNGLLRGLGLEQFTHAWLGEPHTALPVVILVHIWTIAGFYIVLFYAGLLRIPADYSEAARIDGASGWQEFRHITYPLLSEIMKIATVYAIINSVNIFALVYLFNEGRAARYNGVLLTYMYEQAFDNGAYGYACAIGVMTLLTVLLCAGGVSLLFRGDTVEH